MTSFAIAAALPAAAALDDDMDDDRAGDPAGLLAPLLPCRELLLHAWLRGATVRTRWVIGVSLPQPVAVLPATWDRVLVKPPHRIALTPRCVSRPLAYRLEPTLAGLPLLEASVRKCLPCLVFIGGEIQGGTLPRVATFPRVEIALWASNISAIQQNQDYLNTL